MTTHQLAQEQEWLDHLAIQTALANMEAFLDANEAYLAEVDQARVTRQCAAKTRQRKPDECVVVDRALTAQLDLQLCQGELARRRRLQSTRHNPRVRMH